MAAIDEFYDKLVEETTKSFDAMLEQLENQKSKWEELAEIQTIANAYKEAKDVMDMLGISMEDVLNDAPGAFEKFKDGYIQALLGAEGENANFVDGINYALGQASDSFKNTSVKATEASGEISKAFDETISGADKLGSAADTASGKVSSMGSTISGTKQDIDNTASGINDITNAINNVDPSKLDTLKTAVQDIAKAISDPEGGSIVAALDTLNQFGLDGIVQQFTTLQGAIGAVSAALGGSGGEGNQNAPLSPNNGPMGSNPTSGSSEGGGGLVKAIEAVKEASNKSIGGSGGGGATEGEAQGTEGAEGGVASDGTAVGDFTALKGAVDQATKAIGTGDGGGNGDKSSEDLVGAVTNLGKIDHDVMHGGGEGEGDAGVIQDWTDWNVQLSGAKTSLTDINKALQELKDNSPYEAEVKVTLTIDGSATQEFTGTATIGGKPGTYSFSIPDILGLPKEGQEFIAKLGSGKFTGTAKISGSALAHGDWGLKEGGKTLVGELGPEIVIRDSRFWTVGNNGPEFVNLQPGDIVLNHLQSKEVLDERNQVRSLKQKGKAYAEGSNPLAGTRIPFSSYDPEQYAQFNYLAKTLKADTEDMKFNLSDISDNTGEIQRAIQNISNSNNYGSANITFGDLNFTCTGITSADVLGEVQNALEREFGGIALNAYQRAMAH